MLVPGCVLGFSGKSESSLLLHITARSISHHLLVLVHEVNHAKPSALLPAAPPRLPQPQVSIIVDSTAAELSATSLAPNAAVRELGRSALPRASHPPPPKKPHLPYAC